MIYESPSPSIRAPNLLLKRTFDIFFSALGLLCLSWLILLAWLLATLDTGQNGLFMQVRVGQGGKLFRTIKIRTMRTLYSTQTTVTCSSDPRITRLGCIWRRTKIDELPQLINVLFGQMSLVGPRPDVPGFADQLIGADRVILELRPGITGSASLAFRHEEVLLAQQSDPEFYNREIVWPEKVRMNRRYIENYRFLTDLQYILQTLTGHGPIVSFVDNNQQAGSDPNKSEL